MIPILEKALAAADESTVRHALDAWAALGAPAVPRLIEALKHEKSRAQVAYTLGQIGPAARAECPQLQAIVRANPYECTVCERKQMEDQAHYEDLRRAARAAIQRICG